jgi:hypothetical protein
MAKLILTDIASLQSENTAIQAINANSATVEAALENTLSRDGTAPNQMGAPLDMNSNRIINLPTPIAGSDAARLIDIQATALPTIVVPALSGNTSKLLSNDGSVLTWKTPAELGTVGDLRAVNNLSDVSSISAARTNLGLGTAALAVIGVSGDVVGKLNTGNTWSAAQTFTGLGSASGGWTFSGSIEVRLSYTPTTLSADSAGFRGAPQRVVDTDQTLVLNDSGGSVVHTSASGHTWTIPPNSSVAYPNGTTIVLHNQGAGSVTIARGSGVSLRLGGSATDSNKTLVQHGLVTLYKSGTNSWYVSGSGIS